MRARAGSKFPRVPGQFRISREYSNDLTHTRAKERERERKREKREERERKRERKRAEETNDELKGGVIPCSSFSFSPPLPILFLPSFLPSFLAFFFVSFLSFFLSFFPRRREAARVVCHCLGVVSPPSTASDFSPLAACPLAASTLFSPLVLARIERERVCVTRTRRKRERREKSGHFSFREEPIEYIHISDYFRIRVFRTRVSHHHSDPISASASPLDSFVGRAKRGKAAREKAALEGCASESRAT